MITSGGDARGMNAAVRTALHHGLEVERPRSPLGLDYRFRWAAARSPSGVAGKLSEAAVRWLRTRADELGVDADRIVASGESAGAHLAALIGLTGDHPEFVDDAPGVPSAAVAGVVDWYGPANLRTMQAQALPDAVARSDAPDSRESLLIGATLPDAPELARNASPVAYVHSGVPSFHIAHGTADRFVPADQSRQLADALRAAGVAVELAMITGADHMWIGAPDPEALFDAALDFARRVTGR